MKEISDKNEFVRLLRTVHKATSVSGSKYKNIELCNGTIQGLRSSSGSKFYISVDALFDAYSKLNCFTTTTLKPYVKKEVSPALAILIEMDLVKDGRKCCDDLLDGKRSSTRVFSSSLKIRLIQEAENNEVLKEYLIKSNNKSFLDYLVSEKTEEIDVAENLEVLEEKEVQKDNASEKDKEKDKNNSIGCGIVFFLFLISGIPVAVKGEGPVGTIVIVIGGIWLAYFMAKMFTDNN